MTAAHCVEQCEHETCEWPGGETFECYRCARQPLPASALYVAAGWRTIDDGWSAEIAPVQDLIVHESYKTTDLWILDSGDCILETEDKLLCDKPGFGTDLHDIALLRLKRPLTLASPVPLLQRDDNLVGTNGVAQGYGTRTPSEYDALLEQDEFLSMLNETTTPVEDLTQQELLTGPGANQSGTCYGDSGSPLYVFKDGELFVAGFASRLRLDAEGCGSGSLYTSAPAYAQWVYEKAPEAIFYGVRGGGGCSASPWAPTSSSAWLWGIVLVTLWTRGRRNAALGVACCSVVIGTVGCGSSSTDDASLCTAERDPMGWYCDPSLEVIDLTAASALARAEVTDLEGAILWRLRGPGLTPDGNDPMWHLIYRVPGTEEEHVVYVDASGEVHVEATGYYYPDTCIATDPVRPLDSRRITQDALRRFEAEIGTIVLGEKHSLSMFQLHPCQLASYEVHMRNTVRLQLLDEDESTFLYAVYDDEGNFLGMKGPCGSLTECP
jgi:hypothetical protein